ncbi:Threonine/homoserine/homoserine lactone efflux protein [Desulfopila aestuarii DSM 18488]|uniref:Threonine/homoserine/homoserine lactone efflux protein n=2 Tax=Desulfopila aestuarii TaxID=231440 RepID=A0A1M7XZA7_9BACT|nr:LysE family translocator [Desulfopila aestuarii]SHO44519.1 Threonine/homoserine/homoserine lactone efflux protein [Desulfopila aestuarii DSM 18488]
MLYSLNLTLMSLFIPTFLFVSATPGMCMTLSLTLGMTIGVRRALWMMLGELAGVALVSVAAVIGVASIMLNYPQVYFGLKYGGGAYLAYLGFQLWRSRGKMAIQENPVSDGIELRRRALILQGFVTAIANPKGWAFMISLLPPFIDAQLPLAPQLTLLVLLILVIEFSCLLLYAGGGRTLRRFLLQAGNVRMMNRIAGTLMVGVGVWLVLG